MTVCKFLVWCYVRHYCQESDTWIRLYPSAPFAFMCDKLIVYVFNFLYVSFWLFFIFSVFIFLNRDSFVFLLFFHNKLFYLRFDQNVRKFITSRNLRGNPKRKFIVYKEFKYFSFYYSKIQTILLKIFEVKNWYLQSLNLLQTTFLIPKIKYIDEYKYKTSSSDKIIGAREVQKCVWLIGIEHKKYM